MRNVGFLVEKFTEFWLERQKRKIAYLLYDLEEYEQELISQAVRGVRLRPPGRAGMYLFLSDTQRQILYENRDQAHEIYERVRREYPQSGVALPDVTWGANPFLVGQNARSETAVEPIDEAATSKLYKRHGDLVDKKFLNGLTPEELNELVEISQKLDEIEAPLFVDALVTLERAINRRIKRDAES